MADLLASLGLETSDLWTWGAIALVALVVLVILMLVWRFVAARNTGIFISGGRNRQVRLSVVDATPVDEHRRLVLVRRDDVEHLLLIGGHSDIVVEPAIRRGNPAVDMPGDPIGARGAQSSHRTQPAPRVPVAQAADDGAGQDESAVLPSHAPSAPVPSHAPSAPVPTRADSPPVRPAPPRLQAASPATTPPRPTPGQDPTQSTAPQKEPARQEPVRPVVAPPVLPAVDRTQPVSVPQPADAPAPRNATPAPSRSPAAPEPARPPAAITVEPPVARTPLPARPAPVAAPVVDISDPDDDILGGAIEEIESALAVPPARPAPQQRRTEPSFGPDSFERFLDPGPAAVPAARQSDDLKALEDEMEQLLNNLSNPPRR